MSNNKNYTEDAKKFIEKLIELGYDKKDIFTKYVTGGKEVVYPVISPEDGRPHLERKLFK